VNPRSDALLAEIREEFPSFELLRKRDSRLQRLIHAALILVTFGGQRVYLTGYYTAMFGKLWVPESWVALPDLDRYILLRHERVHLRQRRRLGDVAMTFVYLVPFLPLFLAYGRARLEWEAYEETLRATAEVHGLPAAEGLRAKIKKRFTGGDYGWMWPFPRTIDRWYDRAIAEIRAGAPQIAVREPPGDIAESKPEDGISSGMVSRRKR
jgi:hypothetical protein